MSKKSLIVLIVVFVVLLSLVFVKKNMKPEIPTTEEIVDIITSTIALDDLSEIVVRIGDGSEKEDDKPQSVDLVKEGGKWAVKTMYDVTANEKTIESTLEKINELKGELRSDKKGLLPDYGIADDEGIHVELRRPDKKDTHIVIGTEKPSYADNFVRLGGENAVYLVNENLLAQVGLRGEEAVDRKLDVNKWVDKRIAQIKVDDLVGITITQDNGGKEESYIDLRKNAFDDKKKWQSVKPYPFGLNASKIKKIAEQLNSTYAREVVAPDVQGVFDAPAWRGTFTLEDGSQTVFVRGTKDEEEKNYYVKQEGAAYYYLVPVSTFDSRQKMQGDIFTSNPLKVEEDNVGELKIEDMDKNKKFDAVKKLSDEPPAEGEENQEKKEEFVWKTTGGETIEKSKVNMIIGKIKDMNLEVLASASSPKNIMKMSITKEGVTQAYTISEAVKLDNGKECHIFKVGGEEQDYCASKSHIKAIQDALP